MQVASDASSDAELIAAVRAGDSSAFGALYERHAMAARSVARQYVRSASDADDVVSDAFARVLGVLRGGGGPDVTFRAYLFTVVRRLSYGLVSGARRIEPTDDDGTFESALGPLASTEDPALAGFERSVVSRAYRSLPERWQAVLWYTEVEELHPAQIAPILGLSANGVAALAYRAREGLRQAYLQQHLTSTPAQECERINPLLGSYVRAGLSKRETARVEEHLQGCAGCGALVLELGDVSHGMRSVIAPLVLGVGALGLVGTALPVAGGGAVGAGAAGVAGSGGAAGTAGAAGAGGAAGTGSAAGTAGAVGAGATGTGGVAGTSGVAGTGALAGAGSATGTGALGVGSTGLGGAATAGAAGTTSAVGAVGATAASGAATTLAGAAAGAGAAGIATAATGATGIAVLMGSAPLVAVAVTVGVATVTGLGIAGALGAFSPTEPTVQMQTSSAPDTTGPTDAGEAAAPQTPDAASPAPSDATVPTNIPTESAPALPPDASGAIVGDGEAGDISLGPDQVLPVDPGFPPDTGLSLDTGLPVGPAPGTPAPEPPAPEPPLPALDVSLGTLQMAAREPADLRVTASNSGGRAAEQVVVDVALPPGVSTASSVVVARGSAAVPALRAEALVCGTTVPQPDGSSVVTCDVGTLDVGATRDLVITVTADSGGEYAFSAAVSAQGVERVTRTFRPQPVAYYGPQVRVGDIGDVALANPGATRLSVPVRNSGDVPATGVVVAFSLPPGLGLDVGDASGPGGWNCAGSGGDVTCAAPPDMAIAQGTTAVLPLEVYADGTPSGADVGVQVTATSVDGRPSGTRTVGVDVEEAWEGVADVDVTAHCVGPEAPGRTARIVASLEHGASVEQWVRVETPYGVSPERDLAPGDRVEVTIPVAAKPWTPGGIATVVVEREVAGVTYTYRFTDSYPKTDCYVPAWNATTTVEARWIDGSQHLVGTLRNDTSEAMRVRMLGGVYGDSEATTVQPGQTATFTIDTHGRDVPAGSVTFRQYRWVGDRGHVGYVSPDYEESSYVPDWSAPVTARAAWDGDSVTIVGTLRNDTSEAMQVRMLGGAYGDSEAATVQPGQTATFTIDTKSLGVSAGSVTFRQYRWVIDKGYSHTLSTGYDAAAYAPDWSTQVAATPACADDSATLRTTVANVSAEAMTVVVTTPWGTSGPRDVAPGARTEVTVDTGGLTAPSGEVSVALSRTHLGQTFASTTGAAFDGIDCTVRAATASLATGPATYDDERDHSYRSAAVVLDNTASNTAVTFAVTGDATASRTVAAHQSATVALGEAPWTGAAYTVTADGWKQPLTLAVASFSAAPACLSAWSAQEWYDHAESASYQGWNYDARNSGIGVRPDGNALSRLFWERDARCGQG